MADESEAFLALWTLLHDSQNAKKHGFLLKWRTSTWAGNSPVVYVREEWDDGEDRFRRFPPSMLRSLDSLTSEPSDYLPQHAGMAMKLDVD